MKSVLKKQKGAALSEFALMIPIMVLILLWSMFFTDLSLAKMKLLEVSRYVGFSIAAKQISDYASSGNQRHIQSHKKVEQAVIQDALSRFEYLDSAWKKLKKDRNYKYDKDLFSFQFKSPTIAFKYSYGHPFTMVPMIPSSGQVSQVNNTPLGALQNLFQPILKVANKSVYGIYNHMGFNTYGRVTVEVGMELDNTLIPKSFQALAWKDPEFISKDNQNINLKSSFTIYTDHWNLKNGETVKPGGKDPKGAEHPMKKQVEKMTYLGFGGHSAFNTIRSISQVNSFLIGGPPKLPPDVNVVSYNYTKDQGSQSADGEIDLRKDVGAMDGHSNWSTSPFRDQANLKHCKTVSPGKTDCSEYYSTFKARGQFYMGCPKEQESCKY